MNLWRALLLLSVLAVHCLVGWGEENLTASAVLSPQVIVLLTNREISFVYNHNKIILNKFQCYLQG